MADRRMCQAKLIGRVADALVTRRCFKAFKRFQRRQLLKVNLWMHRYSLPGFAPLQENSTAEKDW
jgi:hypothetical protein